MTTQVCILCFTTKIAHSYGCILDWLTNWRIIKTLRFPLFFPTQSLHRTAIFSSAERVISPLVYFNNALGLQTVNAFFGIHKWHYADFTVMYDPCTCDNTAEISIQIRTVKNVEIKIDGHSSGTIQEMISTSNSTSNFNQFTGTMKKSTDQLLSGQKYFKDMSGALAHSDKNTKDANSTTKVYSGLNWLNQALSIGDVKVLNALPYIGEALSIFNVFVGGSSTPTLKVPPMAMELSHNFTGSLTEFNEGALEGVIVPGSNNIPLDNRYPLYNETIGVMNLLDNPKIYRTLGLVEGHVYSFRDMDNLIVEKMYSKYTIGAALSEEPIDIVINPASNLELVEVYGQLHIEFDENPIIVYNNIGHVINNSGFVQVDARNFISPMVPLTCLSEYAFFIEAVAILDISKHKIPYQLGPEIRDKMFNEAKKQFSQKTHLVLTLNLKDDSDKHYVHRYTFNAENSSKGILLNMNSHLLGHPNVGYEYDQFPEFVQQSRTISDDLFWGSSRYNWNYINIDENHTYENEQIQDSKTVRETITILGESTVITNNSGDITELIAGLHIDVNEGVTIEPDTELRIENFFTNCSSATYPIADLTKVTAACTDQRYINRARPHGKNLASADSSVLNPEKSYMEFFPNPASTNLTIQSFNHQMDFMAIIIIFDLQGRIVYQTKILFDTNAKTQNISLNSLPTGMYILEASQSDGTMLREKLIIQQ
jgi:hypothetical protein